ncbi:MAG: 16S rRNA (guanine(527)-N(7))-methyltransferase RsmG [Thermodesulfobacteriota bacterium]|nr:16S rRNA (guanine(527)-N(7))-methyltransferase RsmG [Thermodesulfobacteriota bacterium]
MEEFKNVIYKAAGDINITLTNHQIYLLSEYYEDLLLWNSKMSLVSIKSPLDMPKHFIDSLTVTRFIKCHNSKLLDMGTGAGLPAIPIKIKMESVHVTLLDSSRKKTSFLKGVIRRLRLKDIVVINDRAESLTEKAYYRSNFDIVISRAAFKIPLFLTLGEPFLSEGGTLIAMKGKNIDVELEEAADVMRKTNLELTDCHGITLPSTGELRRILCFRRRQ